MNDTPSSPTVIRRSNLQQLLHAFVQDSVVQGAPPKGLEKAFAEKVQISTSLLSQIKTARPIGDKLARQIESACEKPKGWLDAEPKEPSWPTSAEEAFIASARTAWRAGNAKQKRALARMLAAPIEPKVSQ